IAAATSAAASGGVTTIIEMPFDGGGAINTLPRLEAKQELVTNEAVIDVALLGTLAPDGGWRHAAEMVAAGVVGFKVSLFLTDPVRFPRINDLELQSVMAAVGETGVTLCTHAENNEIIKGLLADPVSQKSLDPLIHSRTRPPVSEALGVLTALETAATQGHALHVCHLSLPHCVDLVNWYRTQGSDVTLEVCPHYLVFTEQNMLSQRGRLKINPPLRTPADREGLWQQLACGQINIISSDHAPWPTELKDHDTILDNHSGVPGVETLVTVTLSEALRRDPSRALLDQAIDALTINPARRYGIDDRKGSLTPGKDADVIVFDPSRPGTIDGSALHSNAGWSPYDGFAHTGVVTHTFSRGRLAFSVDKGLLAHPGDGQLVLRGSR
ncbi:MAG: dihydroorotase family protein, partial [Nakamurella sp.]